MFLRPTVRKKDGKKHTYYSVVENKRLADGRVGDARKRWRVDWIPTEPESTEVDLTVPAGQVFVLGDNRSRSEDSRLFGTVPLQDVVGRVRQVWFSYADGHVRWSRMGDVVE